MQDNNSLARFISDLYRHILSDVAIDNTSSTGQAKEYKRDWDYFSRRFGSEGLQFVTIALPKLGKAVDASLGSGSPLVMPEGFKKSPKGNYPTFLWWLFSEVFEADGTPKPVAVGHDVNLLSASKSMLPTLKELYPDTWAEMTRIVTMRNNAACAISKIRQVCYLAYKLELPYAEKLKDKVIQEFVETDRELANVDITPHSRILGVARNLILRIVSGITAEDFHPKHGPGAVATGEKQWEKMHFKRIYQPLEALFPVTEWCFASPNHLASSIDGANGLANWEALQEGTAKVVLVPKDSRGPRLISCEPLEYQWFQQAISQPLVKAIEEHPMTRGRVNFTDQGVNRRLALEGSLGAGWVTLDMKEASDRVSLDLVKTLFRGSLLLDYLLAARTSQTVLPNGQTIRLNKFAPMGSALCFPVESIVFWALAVSVLLDSGRYKSHKDAWRNVHVYGDDLVLCREDYAAVMEFFPKVGLMFNSGKCCTGGSFRESCGMDAWLGVDVTPVKLRTVWSSSGDASILASYVSYSNELYHRGYWGAARFIQEELDKAFPPVPTLTYSQDRRSVSYVHYLRHTCDHSARGVKFRHRWNHHLHRREVWATCLHTPKYRRGVSGWEKLFWQLARKQSPVSLRSSLGPDWVPWSDEVIDTHRFPLRRRVTHKRRWCAVH